ncbi:fidgetin-like protein 1 [Nematocida major]|uniref:fidgetin-like protein 1 n=1 Tax=Nematocida major TaxID=1912982 RepID=UPI002008615B|nr:fidgetin-like protein 1 [Nematocida major]KAH9385472.1 fidgetin-like protein 1 [Nematocida major]
MVSEFRESSADKSSEKPGKEQVEEHVSELARDAEAHSDKDSESDLSMDEDLTDTENNEDGADKKKGEKHENERGAQNNAIGEQNYASWQGYTSGAGRPGFGRGNPQMQKTPMYAPPTRTARPFKSPITLQTFSTLVMLTFFGLSIYILLTTAFKGSDSGASEAYLKKHIKDLQGKYGKVSPNDCKQGVYFGLDNEFNGYARVVLPWVFREALGTSLDDDEADNLGPKNGNCLEKNLLVYGMPGTGKSFFARKIFLHLALNIQGEKLKKKYGLREIFINMEDGMRDIVKELYECNDAIEMYHINSGMFLTSLVGDSEKSLRTFMQFIDWRQKTIPVLIFMDEADVLLGNRRQARSGGEEVSTNLKNSWLTWMDGIDTDENKKVFIIAATNFFNRIDQGVKRRFGSQLGISTLSTRERKEIIQKTLVASSTICVSKEEMANIIEKTKGFSAFVLTNIIHEMANIKNAKKRPVDYKTVMNAINRNRASVDTEEAERKEAEAISKKHSLPNDGSMSSPTSTTSTLSYDSQKHSIPITKEKMTKIEDCMHMMTDKAIKEKNALKNILSHLENRRRANMGDDEEEFDTDAEGLNGRNKPECEDSEDELEAEKLRREEEENEKENRGSAQNPEDGWLGRKLANIVAQITG